MVRMATAGEILMNQQLLERLIKEGLDEVRAEFTHVKAVVDGLGGLTGAEIAETKRRVDAFASSTVTDTASVAARVSNLEGAFSTLDTAVKEAMTASVAMSGRASTLENQTANLDRLH